MGTGKLICRICLQVCPNKCNHIEENIISLIKLLTAVDVSSEDGLPKVCCVKCTCYLHFVEKMRRLIIKSEVRLRNVLKMDGNFRQLLGKSTKLIIEDNAAVESNELVVEKIEIKQDEMPVSPVQNHVNNEDDSFECSENVENSVQISVQEDTKKSVDVLKNIITKISDDVYHCNVCNKDVHGTKESRSHKDRHMQKTCEICGATTRRDNFFKHMTIHKLGKQVCHVCGSRHKSFDGLRTHMFHFHNEKKRLYNCEECGRKFRYSRGLSVYKRKIHLGFRPYQCESCGKSFFELESLKKHLKLIHLKLREHPCEYCKKQFTSSDALKVHKRLHTNETPYFCDICSEGFRQRYSLKTHLTKHHRDGMMDKVSMSKEDKEITVVEIKEEAPCQ